MLLTLALGALGLSAVGATPRDGEAVRFVRIELPGAARILSLAEVQVFAPGAEAPSPGAARQSSVASGGAPERAIDGNTDGTYTAGSVTHTEAERDAWWELDLGAEQAVERVVVWNRTDCCEQRLAGFTLQLLDQRRRLLWERTQVSTPYPTTEIAAWTEAPPAPSGPTPEVRREFQPRIDAAIDGGIAFLLKQQLWDGSFRQFSDQYPAGSTGLALYTLLKCEVPRDHPAVRRALAWLRAHPPVQTYELGTVLMALEALHEPELEGFMAELLELLLDYQGARADDGKRDGLWAYPLHSEIADLSNTQYAALGLRAAARAGLRVPPRTWLNLLEGVLRYQEAPREVPDTLAGAGTTSGTLRVAGFPYRVGGAASSSMTTAGLGVLGICVEGIGELPSKLVSRVRNARQAGIAWLAYHFTVEANVAADDRWLTYYLYGLERVGALLGLERVGAHDWYWEGAQSLVARQGDNGSWSGDDESDTCFALLFLARATARPDSGGGAERAVPEGTLVSEAPELDVHWRITGGYEAVFFLTGFSDAVRAAYGGADSARGLRVLSVEYRIDGAPIATLPGDPSHAWNGERFAARHDFDQRGSYRCELRVELQAPGAAEGLESTVELQAAPLVVVIADAHDATLLEYARHSADNLLRDTEVSADASTENSPGQSAAKAADGQPGSGWMARNDDPQPRLTLQLARAQRGRVLRFSQPNASEATRGHHDRATRVRVVLNGKNALTFELDLAPSDQEKGVLVLEKSIPLRRVELTVLERVPGTNWPGHVGINEVEWLEEP